MKRSKGFRCKSRSTLRNKTGRVSITKTLKQFQIGDKVAIVQNSSVVKGMPHSRFKGKIGTIVESRGLSYSVRIKDGDKEKFLLARPEHIKPIKS